jgi:serine/threonine protein kinase
MAALIHDFSGIGLNVVWEDTQASFNTLSNQAFLLSRLDDADDSNLATVITGPARDAHGNPMFDAAGNPIYKYAFLPHAPPAQTSQIVLNGLTYTLVRPRGSGTYGIVAEVENGGRQYALKRQDVRNATALDYIREGMIHHILYTRTADAAGESIYVPTFHYMAKSGNYIYFLTELMTNTFQDGRLYPAFNNFPLQPNIILDFLTQIVPLLEFLFNNYNYNHGDFKADNVMYNAAGQYKLIDFGFSRLEINGRVIETKPEFCNFSDVSRDLSQVVKYIAEDGMVQIQNLYRYAPHAPITLANKLYATIFDNAVRLCVCDGKDGHHGIHFYDFYNMGWTESYYNFNQPSPPFGVVPVPPAETWPEGHRNMAGAFDSFNAYLAWIASPASDVPGAPVPLGQGNINVLTAISNTPGHPNQAWAAAVVAALLPPPPPPPPPPPVPQPVPPPGILDRIRDNAGAVALGVAFVAFVAYQTLAFFMPPVQQHGGKKLKRRSRKNRKQLKKRSYVRKTRKSSF